LQESTKECAAAIGLDTDDYLGRMEQQKKLRDEILRQKEQRRHEQAWVTVTVFNVIFMNAEIYIERF
jgi:hypothetical protein